MKKSLASIPLQEHVRQAAETLHKSLIPLGDSGRPLLFYQLKNAISAGIKKVYLIASVDNSAFVDFVDELKRKEGFEELEIHYAIQHIPNEREKPLGTADALQQCLEQYNDLFDENFTVCNGDNLYSSEALQILREPRNSPNALIAYDGQGSGHEDEKIAKFALLDFDEDNALTDILEKPTDEGMKQYQARHNILWVSMNIFNFHGGTVYPFLRDCPVHPKRQEKELPEAVRRMIEKIPGSVLCIPRSEKIPDLTSAEDISTFFQK